MTDRLFAAIFAGIGVVAIVLSVAGRPTVPDGWTVTTGTVVGFVTVDSGDGATQAAVVEYQDGAGVAHRVRSNASFSLGLGDKVGDRISVAYDPARPANGRLLSGTASWAWLVGTCVGALFAVIGGYLLWRQLRPARANTDEAGLSGVIPAGPLIETSRLGGFGYSFPRARIRLWLDLLIAPAMAFMFGVFAFLTFAQGGWLVLFAIAAAGAALLLLAEVVRDIRLGVFAPAAEVGAGGIWLRGVGSFAWPELAEVRHERFVSSAGESGLTMYGRLAVLPLDSERERAGATAAKFANGYHALVASVAGRRGMKIAPLGLMDYEVADFAALLDRVREYFPVTEVSDDPVTVGQN